MGVPGAIADIQPFAELARRPDSAVYKAYQRTLDRVVLLKVLTSTSAGSGDDLRRFAEGARLVARIQHANVVAVYDYGEVDGQAYVVSEYVDGVDLAMLVSRGRIPLHLALFILHEVTVGLEAAHRKDVLHRDIKPANILISEDGDVKLADFGMASHLDDSREKLEVRGTIAYLSPEQLRGERPDVRSDLFALGATFFEMLTARQAFRGDGAGSVMDAVLNFDPMKLVERDRGLPKEVSRVVARLIAKDPAERYQSAALLRGDLEALRSHPGLSGTAALLQEHIAHPDAAPRTTVPGGVRPIAGASAASSSQLAAKSDLPAKSEAGAMTRTTSRRLGGLLIASLALVAVLGYAVHLFAPERNPSGTGAQPAAAGTGPEHSTEASGIVERGAEHTPPIAADLPAPSQPMEADEAEIDIANRSGTQVRPAPVRTKGVDESAVSRDEGRLEQGEVPTSSAARSREQPGARAGNDDGISDDAERGSGASPDTNLGQTTNPPPSDETALEPAILHIGADPWASVYVDERLLGTGRVHEVRLDPGVYNIQFEHPDFPPYSRTVALGSGERDSLMLSLWETVGRVVVRAFPWAEVEIDGRPAGTVPRDQPFLLPPGRFVLTLRNPAMGAVWDTTITVVADQESTIRVEFGAAR